MSGFVGYGDANWGIKKKKQKLLNGNEYQLLKFLTRFSFVNLTEGEFRMDSRNHADKGTISRLVKKGYLKKKVESYISTIFGVRIEDKINLFRITPEGIKAIDKTREQISKMAGVDWRQYQ